MVMTPTDTYSEPTWAIAATDSRRPEGAFIVSGWWRQQVRHKSVLKNSNNMIKFIKKNHSQN